MSGTPKPMPRSLKTLETCQLEINPITSQRGESLLAKTNLNNQGIHSLTCKLDSRRDLWFCQRRSRWNRKTDLHLPKARIEVESHRLRRFQLGLLIERSWWAICLKTFSISTSKLALSSYKSSKSKTSRRSCSSSVQQSAYWLSMEVISWIPS